MSRQKINNNLPAAMFNIYLNETKQEASANTFKSFQALPLETKLKYHEAAVIAARGAAVTC